MEDGKPQVADNNVIAGGAVAEWKVGHIAASLWRLWEVARTAAQKELEKFVADPSEGSSTKNMTQPAIQDMCSKARA